MVNLHVFSSSGYIFCIILSYGLEVGATLDIMGDTETPLQTSALAKFSAAILG